MSGPEVVSNRDSQYTVAGEIKDHFIFKIIADNLSGNWIRSILVGRSRTEQTSGFCFGIMNIVEKLVNGGVIISIQEKVGKIFEIVGTF